MAITAVFFDLGDTLWHFPSMPPRDVVRGQTMKQIAELVQGQWGHDMAAGERRMLGRDIRMAIEEETHRAFHGDGIDPDYPGICRRIARVHDIELTPEQGAELWEAWNLGGQFLGRELFPDVLDTLRELQRRGYRIAAVTNRGYSGPKFREEVRDLGLEELFEAMVVSCEVGYVKPHPRIYLAALEEMGISAAEAMMVGDSMRADVEGAKALGITAVWRRPLADEPVEPTEDEPGMKGTVPPDYAISQIAELLELTALQPRAKAD